MPAPRRLAQMRPLVEPLTGVRHAREAAPDTSTADRLADREGYRADFLSGFEVPLPLPAGARAEDVTDVPGSPANRLDYTHFSIVMSRSRRLAMLTALNLDGAELVSVPRGGERWKYDDRIPHELQIGEALYADNPVDRGHLVRRTAPNWGEHAARANDDTFHFTNCAPQMAGFNQNNWLDLENYLLDHARADGQRLSIFTGPVFDEEDRCYRGVQIPRAFWKVVAFTAEDGTPRATAYMIDQAESLSQLGFMFGQFRTYQRSVRRVEALVGLDFGELSQFDGFSGEERASGVQIEAEIRGPEDIRL